MKYLFYSSSAFASPHFGVLLDEAICRTKEGHEVVFAHCSGKVLKSCFSNINSNPAICQVCQKAYHQVQKKLSKYPIRFVSLDPTVAVKFNDFRYTSLEEFKQIVYKDVWVGYSILSFYISKSRNIEPSLDEIHRTYFNRLLIECFHFVDEVCHLVDEENPDVITIFNGRYYENRAFYDIAKKQNIQFVSTEVVGGKECNENEYLKRTFINSLPHGIDENTRLLFKVWNESLLGEDEKIRLGSSFYEKRRKGISAGDKVYIKGQRESSLPTDFDSDKINIAIFNSSQDEFSALGEEWEYELFKNQIDAINYILTNISDPRYHFYLRIHPNLKDIPYKYHTELWNLDKEYSNLTVIKGDEDISTYGLMDVVNKVIVFGSSTGVEACYWGKPVILVGKSFYSKLGICYIPSSRDELIELCKKGNLSSKSNLNAIKYGFYIMNRDVLVKRWAYLNFNPLYITICHRHFKINRFITIGGSSLIFAGYSFIKRTVGSFFAKNDINHFHFPDKTL